MDYSDLADLMPWKPAGLGRSCRYRFFEEGLFWESCATSAGLPSPQSGARNGRFVRYDSIARLRLNKQEARNGMPFGVVTVVCLMTEPRAEAEELTFSTVDGHAVYEELLVRSLYARAEPPSWAGGDFIPHDSERLFVDAPEGQAMSTAPRRRCENTTGVGSNLQCLLVAGHLAHHFVVEADNLPYEWNSVALDEGQLETGIVIRTKGCPSTFIPPGHPGFPYPCSLEPGHDGPHRAGEHRLNGVGLRWTGTGISARSIVCDAYHEVPAGGFLGCEHDDGHDGLHVDRHGNTWPDPDEFVPEGAGLVDRSNECGHSTGVPGFGVCIRPIDHVGPHADAFKNTWSRV